MSNEDDYRTHDLSDDESQKSSHNSPKNANKIASINDPEMEKLMRELLQLDLDHNGQDTASGLNLVRSVEQEIFKADSDGLSRVDVSNTKLRPAANETVIEQQINTQNRRIDAKFETDIFRFMGYVETDQSSTKKHTRTFEVVGDWIPTIIDTRNNRENFFRVTSYSKVLMKNLKTRNIHKGRIPLPSGHSRYKLMNGKVIDIQFNTAVKLPIIIGFEDLPEFQGLYVIGIREDATLQDLEKSCARLERPLTSPELFGHAIKRAAYCKRPVQLVAYFMPPLSVIGDTSEARDYLAQSWSDFSQIRELEERSPLETLKAWGADLQLHLNNTILSTTDETEKKSLEVLRQRWHQLNINLAKNIIDDVQAAAILEGVHKGLGNHPKDRDSCLFDLDKPAVFTELNCYESCAIEVHLDGMPYHCEAQLEGELVIPKGYTVLPQGASTSTAIVMSALPSLKQTRNCWGNYQFKGELLCASVTPKEMSSDKGRDFGNPILWRERLDVRSNYTGLIIVPDPDASQVTRSYCVAYNTQLLNDHVRRRTKSSELKIYRCYPKELPDEIISPYFEGAGLVGNEIRLSHLLSPDLNWRSHPQRDIRLRLSVDLLDSLFLHPDRVKLYDLEGYLDGSAPLRLELTGTNGQKSVKYFDNSKYEIDISGKSPDDMIKPKKLGHNQDYGEVPLLPSSSSSPVSTPKVGESSTFNLSSLNRPRNKALEGQIKFRDIVSWSNKTRDFLPGDWGALYNWFLDKKLNMSVFNRLYTTHWRAANTGQYNPIVEYHNPYWVSSLKGQPLEERLVEEGPVGRCIEMVTDDQGHTPSGPLKNVPGLRSAGEVINTQPVVTTALSLPGLFNPSAVPINTGNMTQNTSYPLPPINTNRGNFRGRRRGSRGGGGGRGLGNQTMFLSQDTPASSNTSNDNSYGYL